MKGDKWWLYCEAPELFKDPPFEQESWQNHHTWVRHFPQPQICLNVMRTLSPILLWIIFVSTFVTLYAHFLQPKAGWPTIASHDYLEPFLLMNFALALLLVFRTNSSYQRFWEARTVVGKLYHDCRDVARLVLTLLSTADEHIATELVRWDSILCAALMVFVTKDAVYYETVQDLISSEEAVWLNQAWQPPVAVLHKMSRLLHKADLTDYQRLKLEQRLSDLDLCIGSCERISKQPLPLAYTRHTSRLLMTFLTFLPFALWETLLWLTTPVCAVLAFLLVGIENIGVQIEEPFFILPLHSFCLGTRKAVEEVLVQHKVLQQQEADEVQKKMNGGTSIVEMTK